MKDWIKAVSVGLGCGLVVFVTGGYAIYGFLFDYAGMDRIPPDSTAAAPLGAIWAMAWGAASGAILGVAACVLVARYYHQSLVRRAQSSGS